MRRAAEVLRDFATSSVGLEGAFLLVGTACLAVGAGFLHPAGPWVVVGAMTAVVGLLLAAPRRRAE